MKRIGGASAAESTQGTVEERRVLMRVDEVDLFGSKEVSEPPETRPVQAGTAIKDVNGVAFALKGLTEHPQLVEAYEDEAV